MSDGSNDQLLPLRELVSGIREGDEQAVGAFVAHYEPQLRRVLRVTRVIRLLQSQFDSQDLMQSVFMQVIADIRADHAKFSDESALVGYLSTVGRNRLRDHIRRVKATKRDRQKTVGDDVEALKKVAQSGPSPSQIVEVREQVARIEACASPSELKVIKERADGAGWQELASARGLNPEALRKRIERVRRRIREALGGPDADSTTAGG
jgi:RNA polymerase sigma factor (sigma-70 family)